MTDLVTAYTKPGVSYPGYVNITRQDDGSVRLIVRADPETEHGCFICSNARDKGQPGRCTPGDERCNNYCNLAPEKGPMQPHPADCDHMREGVTATLTLSEVEWGEVVASIGGAK